ncbi:MAG: hypothetical protein ACE5ES_00090 [Candidatus Nanoarchaeia archaeon]
MVKIPKQQEGKEKGSIKELEERITRLEEEKQQTENQLKEALLRERQQNAFLIETIRTFNSLSRKVDDLLQTINSQQRLEQ